MKKFTQYCNNANMVYNKKQYIIKIISNLYKSCLNKNRNIGRNAVKKRAALFIVIAMILSLFPVCCSLRITRCC